MEIKSPKILYVEDDVNLGFVTKDNLQKRDTILPFVRMDWKLHKHLRSKNLISVFWM